MIYRHEQGAFVARDPLARADTMNLAAAGLGLVLLQVDYQGSDLRPKSDAELLAEDEAARAAGLEVWWWAFVRQDDDPRPPRPGFRPRRPGGVDALRRRLAELAAIDLPHPAVFVANCEVDTQTPGGWPAGRPRLDTVAEAARAAGHAVVGLSSHGLVGSRWPIEAFDFGLPQLYSGPAVTAAWARMCMRTWGRCPGILPTRGCADAKSTAEVMRLDVRGVRAAGAVGVTWWTERQLRGVKLRAAASAVPGDRA